MSIENQSRQPKGPNLIDILLYLLSKWPWYVLSLVLCLSFAWYHYATAPMVFYAQTKVIIKDPSNKTSTGGFDRYENSINRVNVTNEILQFRSKRLLQEVVARTRADVRYFTREGLRNVNIYGESPVEVIFPTIRPSASFTLSLTPVDSVSARLSLRQGEKEKDLRLAYGKLYKVNGQQIMVQKTEAMSPAWYGREIKIVKVPELQAVNELVTHLGIRQEEKDGTIINIAVTSGSKELDIDILNTIIEVYNQESINDKNQVAVNTANFINERLRIIGSELGGVENELEAYRRDNQVVDIGSMTSRYMGESARYNADALLYDTQLRIAMFIKEYLTDPARNNDLIPTNLGINDQSIESQISHYNSVKLQRDRLIDESSEANPVIEELTNTMQVLRKNILSGVDNIIVSFQVKRSDARGYESAAESRIAAIPRKEREILSIERQQKIKESLYLFLLNRREENALSQAMADNNARIIDGPEGCVAMISPQRNRILGLGLMAGLFVPTVVLLVLSFMNTRVRGRRDIKEMISVPFLGEVPYNKEFNRRRPLTQSRKTYEGRQAFMKSLIDDAFRIVLANITMMTKASGRDAKVLMTTSFRESAGKPFSAINMAENVLPA
ncbi:MAG: chromosome partitioning protein ParA, partial [Duncaniella sp.]|nr:chromosome partitioning protein ParA [Duncaniella sp.]